MPRINHIKFSVLFSLILLGGCGEQQADAPSAAENSQTYLNLSADAHYVGMNTCKGCHQDIYETYIRTGMGRSFGVATREKSSADFSSANVSDNSSGIHYKAYWSLDSLYILEYKLKGRDTLHSRREQVNYIIGSGQHTNSHLLSVNGYIHQMPMTYYTQKGRWDLPPGFEDGLNTRFTRKIGLECMSCHNALPQFVKGSENKFVSLPGGIDCERCHGPGSIHVNQRSNLPAVDTSRFVDYTIVNPAKLPVERQFDICQRCHLQGNALLKEGRSFLDFKPGLKLSDYISVFMPKYSGAEDEFIMASHAERLKLSPCFIASLPKGDADALRPYKGALTCVTCHNPHVSVKETDPDVFNNTCRSCHSSVQKLESAHEKIAVWNDCVSCHMPVSGSTDIPHVSVHDHYIRKPVSSIEKEKIRKFLGLYSVNETQPDVLLRARAYIDQYEKFEQDPQFLDSADVLLRQAPGNKTALRARVQLHFIKREYQEVTKLIETTGQEKCYTQWFTEVTYDNRDAWVSYRIAESMHITGDKSNALRWFEKSVALAPYNLDFRNKYGVALSETQDLEGATEQFGIILRENPDFVPAYANLGYIRLLQGQTAEAKRLLLAGLKLDHDYEALLLNLATCHLQLNELAEAEKVLKRVVEKDPSNEKALRALEQLKKL